MKFILQAKKGSGRGKKLGFPTLNLVEPTVAHPIHFGIYRCFVSFTKGSKRFGPFLGALYYGPRDMFHEPEPSLEIHLLEGSDALPANPTLKRFTIDVKEKIRDIRKFSSIADLKKAMRRDIVKIKELSKNESLYL